MQEKIISKQLKISLPMAFENLTTTLMSLIDAIIIANLGASFVSAIGAVSVILNILQMTPQSINVTNIALMTKNSDDENTKKQYFAESILLCFYLSLLSIVIAILISPIVPKIFKVDAIANTYLFIRLGGFLQSSLLTIFYGYLRVENKQNTVLIIQIVSVISNLIFDLIAVSFGGGIIAVAIVTIAIDTVAMLVTVFLINRKIVLKFTKNKIKDIFNLFKWNFIERIISRIDYFIFNILVARMGNEQYAVHTILVQLSNSSQSFIQGYSDGMTLTIGKINDENKMKNILKQFKRMVFICCFLFSVLILTISIPIILIAFKELSLRKLSFELLPILIINSFLLTYASYYFAYLRGIRKFKFLSIRNFISSCIKIIVATILSFTVFGVFGVWFAYLLYNMVQWLLSQIYYNKLTKTKLLA